MKITVDVDCTPEEARRFLGLPDVAPMQEAMMAQMQNIEAAKITVAEHMERWLEHMRSQVSPKTFESRELRIVQPASYFSGG